ncbi:MAG TPA: DUF2795 domain-containing protein [Solirubrobacteraceae bacterium]|jgi:hypothetical protein|nr:DUF2795 domain-containing protein [Solirubrobacteraceae bacterium]
MSFEVTDVQKSLKGVDYPADGEELAAHARDNGAGEELVEALRRLPLVDGPDQVMQQLKAEVGDELGHR